MTTIAYRSGVLASDSKLSGQNNQYFADCKKIKKVKGWLIGAAGDFGPTEMFMAKFDPKTIEENRFIPWGTGAKDEEFSALVISPKGKIYYMEMNGAFAEIKAKYLAIGSGEAVAMAAMHAGATAIGAIKAAKVHDGGTGGPIQVVKLRAK